MILKILEYAIMVMLIITFIFAYDMAKKEKDVYEKCNKKILCESGNLPKNMCLGYENNKTINITF
jgi:hypothetical protein